MRPSDAWLAALHARGDRAPDEPREALWWGRHRIGSVEHTVAAALELPLLKHERDGWRVHGDLTSGLAQVARALQASGVLRSWRDEQLAVIDDDGAVLGTVERGAVRVLGIATRAVHLMGFAPDGGSWVQQRAWNKSSDPGRWDTLVGGLISAGETPGSALERETWEEAGLRLAQLRSLEWGGHVVTRRPQPEQPHGYIVERLDWYRCEVPPGVTPANRDGEVLQFRCMSGDEVVRRLEADEFTIDAGLIFEAAAGSR